MANRTFDKAYMTTCSEKTLQSNQKGFFMQFAENVSESAGENWILNVFGKLKNDRDRIKIIYEDAKVKEIVIATLSHVQEIYRKKSAEVSQARRFDGDKAFSCESDMKALMFFSQSVLRAPKTGENPKIDNGISFALALWGRSEVLMRLKNYTLALRDVQLALKEGLHMNYKAEAFWRMAICYKAKGEEKRANVSYELAEKMLLKDSAKIVLLKESMGLKYVEKKKICRRVIPVIQRPHPNFPNATAKLLVKEDVDKGRFMVTSEPISTGETIVCEPPYAACLLPECFGTHCHHCFDRLESPIGCTDCSNVAFCKTECRDTAMASYHKYECKFLDLLIGSGMSILSHTALRMVTQNTAEKMHEISKNRRLERIYSLCTLSEKREAGDYLQRTLMAAFLLRCLQKSGYFGYIDDNVIPNENQIAVGELLLYHLQMLQFNAHEIFETKHSWEHKFRGASANYIGVAVYPTVSLFNHDCAPGVSRHFVGKNIVINALRPLEAGEMIAENYGPIFTRRSVADRQKSLAGRYWFQCKCLACLQNWPSFANGLATLSRRIRCPTTKCPYFFPLPQPNESTKCPKCKHKVSLTENATQMKNCEQQYFAAFDCLDKEQSEKGIKILCDAIDKFYRISTPPHSDTHLGQECLRTLMAGSGNVYEISSNN